jgi:hypothetical protein
MTDLPNWAVDLAFKTQTDAIEECRDYKLAADYTYPFYTGRAKEALDKHIGNALVETINKAIKIISSYEGDPEQVNTYSPLTKQAIVNKLKQEFGV